MDAIVVLQGVLLIMLTPLFKGFTKVIKAWLRGYQGPSIFQTYYDWLKLIQKGRVLSSYSTAITRIAPSVALGAVMVSFFLVPVFYTQLGNEMGNLWIVVFLLVLVKVCNVLIGLDAGSSFGGMGTSRELFVGLFAEPVLVLILCFLYIENQSFNGFELAYKGAQQMTLAPGHVLAALAFLILILAENARMPVDNPETHLELTMIHEAMLLDLSGPELAYAEMAATGKLLIYMTLFINIFYPTGIATMANLPSITIGIIGFCLKMMMMIVLLSINEVTYAKFRLLRVPELLGLAFALALTALAVSGLV